MARQDGMRQDGEGQDEMIRWLRMLATVALRRKRKERKEFTQHVLQSGGDSDHGCLRIACLLIKAHIVFYMGSGCML